MAHFKSDSKDSELVNALSDKNDDPHMQKAKSIIYYLKSDYFSRK